jgi:hypothetical protein
MKIVTDGKDFAIEKGWFFKRYVDLEDPEFDWSPNSKMCFYCWSNKERVKEVFEMITRKKKKIRKATKDELQ